MDQCIRHIVQDLPIDLNDEKVIDSPISRANLDGTEYFLLNQPEYIQHVLQNKHNIYHKEGPFIKYQKMFLGCGLPTTEGKTWDRQHQLLLPCFGKQSLDKMAAKSFDVTLRFVNDIEQHLSETGLVDIHHSLMLLTLKIIAEALFSVNLNNEQANALLEAEKTATFTSAKLVKLSEDEKKTNLLLTAEYEKAKKVLDDFAYQTIENRRKSDPKDDLLKVLLDAQKSNPEITDVEIRDQIFSFLIGGHDTCGQTLTWGCYLLSQHKEIEEKLRADVNQVIGDREFQQADLEKMTWPLMVFKETLRLFPPGHMLTRVPASDDVIGGIQIPAGSIIIISPWVTHRNKNYWTDPFTFDPTRFSKNTSPNSAFIPFGGGPRVCLGQGLAFREGTLILAALAKHFTFELPPKQRVQAYGALTLTPRFGLKLILKRA